MLATLETGIYVSRAYLASHGTPLAGGEFKGHDLVVYQQRETPVGLFALCGKWRQVDGSYYVRRLSLRSSMRRLPV